MTPLPIESCDKVVDKQQNKLSRLPCKPLRGIYYSYSTATPANRHFFTTVRKISKQLIST